MQGNKIKHFNAQGMILAFQWKINLGKKCILDGKNECFSNLCEYFLSKQLVLNKNVKIFISQHLTILSELVGRYFVLDIDTFLWIQNPFHNSLQMQSLSLKEREQLIYISANFELRSKFNETELTKFWITLREEFSEISIQALKLLLRFLTTYLCEKTFSLYCMQPLRLNTETGKMLKVT